MRILVISQMYPCKRHPTSAIFFANLIKKLAKKVEKIVVVTPRPYIPKVLTKVKPEWKRWFIDPMVSIEENIHIIRPYVLQMRGMGREGLNGILMYLSLLKKCREIVKENDINIILGYNLLPDGIATVKMAKRLKLPSGMWAIGSDVNDFVSYNRINYYLTMKNMVNSDLILTESKDLELKVKKILKKKNNVLTFYKGIEVTNFNGKKPKDDTYTELSLRSEYKYLLFVGRLIYDKGIYELTKAFREISKRYPEYRLILLGEETEKDKLMEHLKNYGILERVIFRGIVPYNQVADYMKVSEMLLFSSWAEGLPNVVLESMASGLPVVTTDVGGIPEVVVDEVTGLLVPPRDTDALTAAALRMIEDNELRQRCIINARELVLQRFDVNKNVDTLYEVLKEVIKGKNKKNICNPFGEQFENNGTFSIS